MNANCKNNKAWSREAEDNTTTHRTIHIATFPLESRRVNDTKIREYKR